MASWSAEELSLLLTMYESSTNSELDRMFPKRSRLSVYKRAYKMGLRKKPDVEFKNRSASKLREKGSNCNGGISITSKGYRQVLMPEHPRADVRGYVMEHIVVWEKANNSTVPIGYAVHHINGKKDDNRPENLVRLTHSEHTALHNSCRVFSSETRDKIRHSALLRLSNKRNHPSYKEVDIDALHEMKNSGAKVKDICKKFGIGKTTLYEKLKENYL